MYTLKSIVRRGTSFAAILAIVAASVLPATSVFADDLNPLTDRSLTLSSGSPGWSYTDGSGNSTYAPPNSGANGQKTGNTFGFKVSSSATVKAFSFQYCTTSAGNCMGPGDNLCASGTTGGGDCVRQTNAEGLAASPKTSDLEVIAPSASQGTMGTYVTDTSATTNPNGIPASVPAANSTGNNFLVYYNNAGTWTESAPAGGWQMSVIENQSYLGAPGDEGDGRTTAKANYIVLTNSTGQTFTAGQDVRIVFFGTDTNYITNPGSDAFFVKINDYSDDTLTSGIPDQTKIIDGGVTVANVMNESIQIQTKVLETMDFSVGTVDPNTLASDKTGTSAFAVATGGQVQHKVCDRILPSLDPSPTAPKNVLKMGNEDGEFSLETDHTYSTHSYWRLSSNSSAGATVYYSGVTLSNTVGDEIDAIGTTSQAPAPGSEQFGLALDNGDNIDHTSASGPNWTGFPVVYNQERTPGSVFENGEDNGLTSLDTAGLTTDGVIANGSWHSPQLSPLAPTTNYGNGSGPLNSEYVVASGDPTDDAVNTQKFAFDPNSNHVPVPVATESSSVVDCVTGKPRYIANIAATTPAGIYTTKVNWIAAPQY